MAHSQRLSGGLRGLVLAACALTFTLPAFAAPPAPVAHPLSRPAAIVRHPDRAALLGVAQAGERIVAVGERGLILYSDDAARTWKQAIVPVSVTLTAVHFPVAKLGWAVGHSGVVLHSADGGATWTHQLDGMRAAGLMLQAAQREVAQQPSQPAPQRHLVDAQQVARDGPDKPFLDVYFQDERRGFVVGAFNLMFTTVDGGASWQAASARLDNPDASHLYAVRGAGRNVYVAGERGLVLVSTDGGERFTRVSTPYQGSYFAAAVLPDAVVVAGLRGNAYRSADGGASWQKLELPQPVSVNAAAVAADGSLLLATQSGQVLRSRDQGRTLEPAAAAAPAPLAALAGIGETGVVAVGFAGVSRLSWSGAAGGKP